MYLAESFLTNTNLKNFNVVYWFYWKASVLGLCFASFGPLQYMFYWPVLSYIQSCSSTSDIFSNVWGWPENDGHSRLSHCSTMWTVRPHWTSQLVQGWNKAPTSEWSRHPVRGKFEESSCLISRAGSHGCIPLRIKGWWHPVHCGCKRWCSKNSAALSLFCIATNRLTAGDLVTFL